MRLPPGSRHSSPSEVRHSSMTTETRAPPRNSAKPAPHPRRPMAQLAQPRRLARHPRNRPPLPALASPQTSTSSATKRARYEVLAASPLKVHEDVDVVEPEPTLANRYECSH